MTQLDIHQILQLLPHRYPFLLVDRVLECKANESIVAVKNVSYNESFFQGHFPAHKVMPGVLILEAMAQATGLLGYYSLGEASHLRIYYLVGVDKARFRKPVGPGDQLMLHATLTREIRGIYQFAAEARVDGELVASANFMTKKMELEP
jgi:3-hydroxyacyl-[acyl-carrier-protein] dehydratase